MCFCCILPRNSFYTVLNYSPKQALNNFSGKTKYQHFSGTLFSPNFLSLCSLKYANEDKNCPRKVDIRPSGYAVISSSNRICFQRCSKRDTHDPLEARQHLARWTRFHLFNNAMKRGIKSRVIETWVKRLRFSTENKFKKFTHHYPNPYSFLLSLDASHFNVSLPRSSFIVAFFAA